MKDDLDHLKPLDLGHDGVRVFVNEYRHEEESGRRNTEQNTAYLVLHQRIDTDGRDRRHQDQYEHPAIVHADGNAGHVRQGYLLFQE